MTDILYTGVGLGILAVNRMQVAKRQIQADIAERKSSVDLDGIGRLFGEPDRARQLFRNLRDEFQDVDDRLGGVNKHSTETLEHLEAGLPEGARQLSEALRSVTDDRATQLRAVLSLKER